MNIPRSNANPLLIKNAISLDERIHDDGNKVRHVFEDAQGSMRLVTNDNRQIIETLDFDAFNKYEFLLPNISTSNI